MNETTTRILSGIIYALLLLIAIFISEYTFAVLVLVFGFFTLYELLCLIKLKSVWPYVALLVFMGVFNGLYEAITYNILLLFAICALVVDLLLIRDLVVIKEIPLFQRKKYLMVIFYMISSFVFMTLIPHQNPQGNYDPHILMGVFVLIWTNDSLAYVIGKTIGKHKLYQRISPNKTIEGFVGGLLCTLLMSYVVYSYTETFDFKIWLVIAAITSIFGTFGDLIQSKLKRQAAVKDSGKLMPGHGGLFDRLDSILFASTFIFLFLVIINHVS